MNKVVVYGSLKSGHHNYNHYLLPYIGTEEVKFLGYERLKGFMMWRVCDWYPSLFRDNSYINVEVYEVSEEVERNLDLLEGIPDFYQKEVVNTSFGEASIYLMDHRHFERERFIVDGDWK